MLGVDRIEERFLTNNPEVLIKTLRTIEFYQNLTLSIQSEILGLISHKNREVANMAVICAKQCALLKTEARNILIKCLKHKDWVIRANASKSLAYLGVKDEEAIDAICQLFGDEEGHDFSPEESAIEALGIIGPEAIKCVPQLIQMINDEFDGDKYETFIILIYESLSQIDVGSQEFIQVLIRGVKECRSVGIANAIRHLTAFKSKSQAVLPILEKFVEQDEWLDGDYMTDESDELILLKALYFIAGADHRLLFRYLEVLKKSDYYQGKLEAIEFEKSWLGNC